MNKYIIEVINSLNENYTIKNKNKSLNKQLDELNNSKNRLEKKQNELIDRYAHQGLAKSFLNNARKATSKLLDKIPEEKLRNSKLGKKLNIDNRINQLNTLKSKIYNDKTLTKKEMLIKIADIESKINNLTDKEGNILSKRYSYTYVNDWKKRALHFLTSKYQYTPMSIDDMERKTGFYRGYSKVLRDCIFSGTIVVDGVKYYVVGKDGRHGNNTSVTSNINNYRGIIVLSSLDFIGTDIELQLALQHEIGHEQLNTPTIENRYGGLISDKVIEARAISAVKQDHMASSKPEFNDLIAANKLILMDKYGSRNTNSNNDIIRSMIYRKLNKLSKEYIGDHANATEAEADKYAEMHLPPQWLKIAKERGIDIRFNKLKMVYDDSVAYENKLAKPKTFGTNKFKNYISAEIAGDINYRTEASKYLHDTGLENYYKSINPRKFDREYPQPEDNTSPERKARQELIAKKSAEQAKRNEEKQSKCEDAVKIIQSKNK